MTIPEEDWPEHLRVRQPSLLRRAVRTIKNILITIGAFGTLALVAWTLLHRHHGTSPDTIATIIGVDYCDNSGYQIVSRLDGSKSTIYDCTTGARTRCVTYENGIATNQTVTVRLLFADTLGSGKPRCIGG